MRIADFVAHLKGQHHALLSLHQDSEVVDHVSERHGLVHHHGFDLRSIQELWLRRALYKTPTHELTLAAAPESDLCGRAPISVSLAQLDPQGRRHKHGFYRCSNRMSDHEMQSCSPSTHAIPSTIARRAFKCTKAASRAQPKTRTSDSLCCLHQSASAAALAASITQLVFFAPPACAWGSRSRNSTAPFGYALTSRSVISPTVRCVQCEICKYFV